MTQGKLYEKILEGKRGQYTDSIWSVDDEIYFEVIEVADGHLKSILDEAKKEFENLSDSNYRNNVGKEYLDFWNELDVLIKKWFGDSQP